jgi:hypothetical protein
MARLTSRASVLAALDLPAEEPVPPPASAPMSGASPLARASWRSAYRGPRGYEIWTSARRQAEFYVAYAEMLETDRRPRDSGDAWVQEGYPAGHWVGPAALATSYRLAAQHAALVDARWATRLAVRAGMAYVAAGLPFGLFLLTGLLDDQTLRDSTVVRDLVVPFREPDATEAVHHPVQLTYLLLAAASRPWLRDPLRQTLSGADQRLAAHGLYPIGSQGLPLGEYVELANAMRYDDETIGPRSGGGSAREIAARLAGLHRAHAAILRAAQRNRYLWRQGASPVNIIDLEQVAMSGLALRHRPWFGELSANINTELNRDDELAQLPVWTMRSIDTELPDIAPSVANIMREPDRAWHTEDFREPDTEGSPWDQEAAASAWTEAELRVDRPYVGPTEGIDPLSRPYSTPERGDDEEDGGDDPYFG